MTGRQERSCSRRAQASAASCSAHTSSRRRRRRGPHSTCGEAVRNMVRNNSSAGRDHPLSLNVACGTRRSSEFLHSLFYIYAHGHNTDTLPVSFEIRRLTRACNSKDAALSALALLRQAIHARPTAPATPGVPALGSLLFLLMCQMLICRARAVAAITVLRTPLQPMAR